jgi:hypothetical protein
VTAVIYASKLTPNAYYLAFEDGPVGANPNEFNNDGDYNDYVYFFTGLTCSGGGQQCDTGKLGVCAPGITQCTANGVTCQELVPSSPESCDGIDNDCNGTTDEGDLCSEGFVCDKGTCVKACGSGEFVCPPDKVCDAAGFCVDPACKDVACPAGEVCVGGECKAPCDGVVCPYPTECRVGVCVDPCAGVMCEQGQVCDKGVRSVRPGPRVRQRDGHLRRSRVRRRGVRRGHALRAGSVRRRVRGSRLPGGGGVLNGAMRG